MPTGASVRHIYRYDNQMVVFGVTTNLCDSAHIFFSSFFVCKITFHRVSTGANMVPLYCYGVSLQVRYPGRFDSRGVYG